VRRKPKVSPAMLVIRRLGGPKVRPEGVTDGYPVEIPDLGDVQCRDASTKSIPHCWLLWARKRGRKAFGWTELDRVGA
jgi:hypothetical protein